MSTGPPGHIEAIETAFRDLQTVEWELEQMNDEIARIGLDEWGSIDAEPLMEKRNILRYLIFTLVGDIVRHGYSLIDGWKEHELDNIGRHYSTVDGPLALVLRECPGIDTHPVFQRLTREAVCF